MWWSRIIFLRSLEKGIPWKFWLNPWFPLYSKQKWILKWLSLDKGYFNFIFANEDGLWNNPGTYVFFISNFIIFLSHVGIVMHIVHIKMSRNLILLICDLSKKRWRGNFGSILDFSSFQVKVKFKVTAS